MMISKQVLRKNVKAVLKQIPAVDIQHQSENITNALIPILEPYASIACYMSMGQGEFDTKYIIKHLFEVGNKKVYLPRCTTTNETGHKSLRGLGDVHHPHLTFHELKSWEQVNRLNPQGKYQLREPEREDPAPHPPKLDVILTPGVAFQLDDGRRIGHGAGYYDDFFQRYHIQHNNKPNHKKPILLGLALNQQIVDCIPREAHDYFMDGIVCGDGKIHWINK